MTPEERFTLTPGEQASQVWIRLEAELQRRLQKQRERNDDPKLTEQETAKIRGHIECLRSLLRLGEAPPVISD